MNGTCFACGAIVSDGLKIFNQVLCLQCEAELVHSRANKIDYQHWVDTCRRLWEQREEPLDVEQTEED